MAEGPTLKELFWHPISHYKDINSILANKSGIYIWGFKNDFGFAPYYVGKAWNIADRLCTHLSSIKGGTYTIFAESKFFDPDKKTGWLYKPESIEKRIEFLESKNKELQKAIDNMIKLFHFTYTELTPDEYSKYGADMEKSTLNFFGKTLINTRYGKPNHAFTVGNLHLEKNILSIL